MKPLKVVVIGAGRIGLGCAAPLAHRGGMDVVILGRGPVINQLNRHRGVQVQAVHGSRSRSTWVPVRAVDMVADQHRARAEIATADLVCTAVGPTGLKDIAPLLAEALVAAPAPVDVIAFENMEDAATLLRSHISTTGATHLTTRHGFAGAVVDRVVAHRYEATARTPVTVVAEPTCRVVVDSTGLTRDWSEPLGVHQVEHFRAWYRAKLYCYSAGHATAAYLGLLKGYRFVHAAVTDPEIAAAVLNAMEEGRQGLLHRYGPEIAGTSAGLHDILERFGNAALGDTVERVARDVPRKIARRDRLTGAARAARAADVVPNSLAFTIAAAMHSHLDDLPAGSVARRRTISDLLHIKPTHPLALLVEEYWARLIHPAVLLSLHTDVPAWEPSPAAERSTL